MVYTKSSGNEGQFPCHGSRAIPHSTSYTTSGLNSLRQLQKFPETPISIIEEHQFLNINSRNAQCIPNHLEMKADSQVSTEEVCSFTQTPQEEAPHSNKYVRATLSLLPQWNGHRDAQTQQKTVFPCSGLNAGSSFISQDEGMSESPMETTEKALCPCHIWTGGLTSLLPLERHAEFNASKDVA